MKLPRPADKYDPRDQAETRANIERAIGGMHKRGEDVEIGDSRLILKSPDGTRWSAAPDNTGAWVLTAL